MRGILQVVSAFACAALVLAAVTGCNRLGTNRAGKNATRTVTLTVTGMT